jgi:hypothetical protein
MKIKEFFENLLTLDYRQIPKYKKRIISTSISACEVSPNKFSEKTEIKWRIEKCK